MKNEEFNGFTLHNVQSSIFNVQCSKFKGYEVSIYSERSRLRSRRVKSEESNSSSSATNASSATTTQPAAAAASGKPVVAPLPGTINEIKVKVGDKVNTGDTVVILEAMKMQNNIEAETSGTITSINVNKGDAVMEGDTLVTIA